MRQLVEIVSAGASLANPFGLLCGATLRASLILMAALGVAVLLRRTSAAVQHRVWAIALVATLVAPAVWMIAPGWQVPLFGVQVAAPSAHAAQVAHSPAAQADARRAAWDWTTALVLVCGLGGVVQLAVVGHGVVQALRLVRSSSPCRDAAWRALVDRLQAQIGLRRPVELCIVPRRISPAAWSLGTAWIVLPDDCESWSSQRRQSVLLHELAHVQRRDCELCLMGRLACAVWWFHPLAWYAARQLRKLSERAADDFVLRSGQTPASYAEDLLSIARSLSESGCAPSSPALFERTGLEARLSAVLDPRRPRDMLSRRGGLSGLLAAVLCVLPLMLLTPSIVYVAKPSRPLLVWSQPAIANISLPLTNPFQRDLFQVLPNWEVGRKAAMLLPNYEPGTVNFVLLDRPDQPPASTVAYETIRAEDLQTVPIAPLQPPTALTWQTGETAASVVYPAMIYHGPATEPRE